MTGCAVVTGASRGIGAATARWLARAGVAVVLVARDAQRLERVAVGIRAEGGRAVTVPADVSAPEAATQVLGEATARADDVVALVNNAGVIEPVGRVDGADLEAWRRCFDVNLFAAVAFCQAALPQLRATHGRLVNVGSGLVDRPLDGLGPYTTSKAALAHLTRVLAVEEPDVTTCGYLPGPVDTDMLARLRAAEGAAVPPATVDRFRAVHAAGTLNDPDQAGRAVAWLALHAGTEERGRMVSWQEPGLAERVAAFPHPSSA